MSYSCNTCKKEHGVGEICKEPMLSELEKYKEELQKKYKKFNCGYGEITTVILNALHTKLFGETYEK